MKIWRWGAWPLMACALWLNASCDEGSSDETAEMDTEPTPEVGDTEDDDTEEPPGAESRCEDEEGPCAGEGLCDAYPCGGRAARFNHFGCDRVACTSDDECPSGEACFTLAYERTCEPTTTTCTAQGDACVCEATQDCDGVLLAHCLPEQFYPSAQYCDPSVFSCEELPAWADALQRAADAATPSLAEPLAACAQTALSMAQECS